MTLPAFRRRSPAFACCVAVLLLMSVTLGCGPGQGRVIGRVLLDGKPVPGGLVRFLPADGRSSVINAEIDESGNYSTVMLPVGDVIVSVDNRQFAPRPPSGGPIALPKGISPEALRKMGGGPRPLTAPPAEPRSARYVEIPARYYAAETSGLRLTIQMGDQQHDVLLAK